MWNVYRDWLAWVAFSPKSDYVHTYQLILEKVAINAALLLEAAHPANLFRLWPRGPRSADSSCTFIPNFGKIRQSRQCVYFQYCCCPLSWIRSKVDFNHLKVGTEYIHKPNLAKIFICGRGLFLLLVSVSITRLVLGTQSTHNVLEGWGSPFRQSFLVFDHEAKSENPHRNFVPNFRKVEQPAAELLRFNHFQYCRRNPSWIWSIKNFDLLGAFWGQNFLSTNQIWYRPTCLLATEIYPGNETQNVGQWRLFLLPVAVLITKPALRGRV